MLHHIVRKLKGITAPSKFFFPMSVNCALCYKLIFFRNTPKSTSKVAEGEERELINNEQDGGREVNI